MYLDSEDGSSGFDRKRDTDESSNDGTGTFFSNLPYLNSTYKVLTCMIFVLPY